MVFTWLCCSLTTREGLESCAESWTPQTTLLILIYPLSAIFITKEALTYSVHSFLITSPPLATCGLTGHGAELFLLLNCRSSSWVGRCQLTKHYKTSNTLWQLLQNISEQQLNHQKWLQVARTTKCIFSWMTIIEIAITCPRLSAMENDRRRGEKFPIFPKSI